MAAGALVVPLISATGRLEGFRIDILSLFVLYVSITSGDNQSQASQGSHKSAGISLISSSSPQSNQFQWQRLTSLDESLT